MKISFLTLLIIFINSINAFSVEKKAIILIGAPASGKGFLSSGIIKNDPTFTQISVGDILRSSNDKSLHETMKSGKLVSDEIIFAKLDEDIAKNKYQNIILDGVPRAKSQIQLLSNLLKKNGFKLDSVAFIQCSTDVLIDRMQKRASSSKNVRQDDNIDVFKKRIEIYNKNSPEIVSYYQKLNPKLVKTIDCTSKNTYEDFVGIKKK